MANPRKFSEKIALHTQKQAEETAAFEEIMREVMGATRVTPSSPFADAANSNSNSSSATNNAPSSNQLSPTMAGGFSAASRAGSLPNVNQIGQQQQPLQQQQQMGNESPGQQNTIDLQSCLNNLEDMKNGVNLLERSGSMRGESSGRASQRNASPHLSRSPHRQHGGHGPHLHHQHHHGSSQNLVSGPGTLGSTSPGPQYGSSQQLASFSGGGGLSHQKRSQSPYSSSHHTNSAAYLSPPPPEGHWRRTASDSALHQSALLSAGGPSPNHHQNLHHHSHHNHHHNFHPQNQNQLQHQQQNHQQNHFLQQQQQLDGFSQLMGGTGGDLFSNGNNSSPTRRPTSGAMVIDGGHSNMTTGFQHQHQQQDMNGDLLLLSASLPDHHNPHLRPRSCEVPGINIYPSDPNDQTSATAAANAAAGQGVSGDHNHHLLHNSNANNSAISSNTGSLPDLTNLTHFPGVPLHAIDGSSGLSGGGAGDINGGILHHHQMMHQQQSSGGPNSPYSNGPDSPFSPGGSSANSNLSPPPPCNMMGSYSGGVQDGGVGSPGTSSPRRQTSPGPSPSPTATRRRAHHNVNNLVIGTGGSGVGGNSRSQQIGPPSPFHPSPASSPSPHPGTGSLHHTPQQTPQHTPQHTPPHSMATSSRGGSSPGYASSTFAAAPDHSPQYSSNGRFKSPPRITVEGLALDTSALSLNSNSNSPSGGNGQQQSYQQVNSPSDQLLPNSPFGQPQQQQPQQQQFHFTNSQSFQSFAMGMHRSTTPTDSCSAPTSPASQNISPSNSPELPIHTNGGGNLGNNNQQGMNQQFGMNGNSPNSYNSYSSHHQQQHQQQANILQHQLEQFRMTSDSEGGGSSQTYMMSCNSSDLSLGQIPNAFYLDSTLNAVSTSSSSTSQQQTQQYTNPGGGGGDQHHHHLSNGDHYQQQHQQQQHQSINVAFTSESSGLYFTSSQLAQMTTTAGSNNNGGGCGGLYNTSSQQQQLTSSHSSHCTTPQTPSSIPDIILTGPNLDELTASTTDFVKDLSNSMININNTSFDSDIFCSASDDIRPGTFDSFDLDNLPILPDIDSNTE